MEFFEVILSRRSIRRFSSSSITNDELRQLLEAARWAPSGGNKQPWRFVVVRDPKMIMAMKMFAEGLYGLPPLIIAVCSKEADSITLLDLGMATENLLLATTDLELGGCAVASFSEKPTKRLLDIPDDFRIVLLVSIGRPEGEPKLSTRKDLSEIAFSEKWGKRLDL